MRMSGTDVDRVADLVGTIYQAAFDQERWTDVLTGMADLFDGSRACIARFDAESISAVGSVTDPEVNSPAGIAVFLRDPLSRVTATMPVGAVYHPLRMLDEAEFRRGELWLDWYRPRDMHDGLACNLLMSGGFHWFLDIQRGAGQPAFDAAEAGLLRKFVPHLQRAGEIGRSLEKTSAFALAFSHLPFGVAMVDENRRVVQINQAAEAMLARPGSPLRLKSGLIEAASPGSDLRALDRLIWDACAMPGIAFSGGGTMLMPSGREQPERRRFVLSVAPLVDARAYGLAADRCAVVMMREVGLEMGTGFEDHVRSAFGLTRAEARLAAALASGRSLKEAAVDTELRFSTVRTYLDRIFRKTGTNQQSQLVALLKSVAPVTLGGPDG